MAAVSSFESSPKVNVGAECRVQIARNPDFIGGIFVAGFNFVDQIFIGNLSTRLFTTFSKKFKLYQKILVFSDVDKITLLKSLKKFKLYQKILVFSDVDKITLLNLLVDKLSKLTVIGSV